jgi:hypothetical protein
MPLTQARRVNALTDSQAEYAGSIPVIRSKTPGRRVAGEVQVLSFLNIGKLDARRRPSEEYSQVMRPAPI